MAHDFIYPQVRAALIADGWVITQDPFEIDYKGDRLESDLGAERLITAEQGTQQIVVEIKSFRERSFLHAIGKAVGQYTFYRVMLEDLGSPRTIWMAISTGTAAQISAHPAAQLILATQNVSLLIVDIATQEVVEWRTSTPQP